MSIETALYQVVTGAAAFTSLAGTRLYGIQMPQDTSYPCAVWQRISTRAYASLVAEKANVGESIFQYDSFGKDYAGAKALADALRQVLEGYRGTVAGTQIGAIQFEDRHDNNFEPFPEIYMICSQFRVWYYV